MELDIENFDALREYLTRQKRIQLGEAVSFENLHGGVSNRTVKVAWTDGRGWVLKQALPKLRVNVEWLSDPKRIQIEARALRWFNRSAPHGTTPIFVFQDDDQYLLAMEAIPSEHENWKSVLLSGRIDSRHFRQFGTLLGTIHRQSSNARSETSIAFADNDYFRSLRLDPYYLYTAERIEEAAPFLKALVAETLLHKHCLVHGDFSPKNTLLYRDNLILLDYEVVHFGDPAFDVGFALTHFLSKAHHLPRSRARLSKAAKLFWQEYYEQVAGWNWAGYLEARSVRHTIACLLARVAGKSPLEYLTSEEKERQLKVLLTLVATPPLKVRDLIREFICKIETYGAS
jgi:5-methylthioribose kinase